jgi:dTDP-4-dehydrorhamnose reductase
MKVLITGGNGQLAKDLHKILTLEHEVFSLGRAQFDVTNMGKVREIVNQVNPDVIIHSAAYTGVDLAESEEEKAYLVNSYGTRNVAIVSEEIKAKLCYISTDYVFDGRADSPYKEYDNTNPLGVYGKSKRAGEQLVQSLSTKYFIVRTSWVYGLHGNNFVKTMLKLAGERDRLKVVHDQIGSPTYTVDLAKFLSSLIQTEKYGIYHATNMGACSWYEFATAIFEESGVSIQIEPCTTEEFPRPAPRPKYSVLDHLAIRANGFEDLRHWRDALRDFIKELNRND